MFGWLKGLIRWVTNGWAFAEPPPPAEPDPDDLSADKTTIETSLREDEGKLQEVYREQEKHQKQKDDLEAQVIKEGDAVSTKVLFEIQVCRAKLVALQRRELVLSARILGDINRLGVIAVHDDAKPVKVSDRFKAIGERIQDRVSDIHVDLEEIQEAGEDLRDLLTVSTHEQQLAEIKRDILDRNRKETEAPSPTTRDIISRAERAAQADSVARADEPKPPAQERAREPA